MFREGHSVNRGLNLALPTRQTTVCHRTDIDSVPDTFHVKRKLLENKDF